MHKYWAFISYSHSDTRWADWLHRKLETYRPPKQLIGTEGSSGVIPKRLFPIFRDREELPTSASLGDNISAALQDSRYLIAICSPRAAQSRWVAEEILAFKRLGRSDRILCLIVEGEPNATDHGEPVKECFPEPLRFEIGTTGELTKERTEPIAADVRPGKDRPSDAMLKLAAGLLGVDYDALRQREKRRSRIRMLQYMGLVLSILAIFAGTLAWMKTGEERKLREQESARLTLNAQRLNAEDQRGKALAYLARAIRLDAGNVAAADLTYNLLAGHAWPVLVSKTTQPPRAPDVPKGWMVADSTQNVRKRRSPPAECLETPGSTETWDRQYGEPGEWLAIRQRGDGPERLQLWRVGEGGKWTADLTSRGEPFVGFDSAGKVVYAATRPGMPKVDKLPDGNVKLTFPAVEIRAWEVETGSLLQSPLPAEQAPGGLGAICGAISGDRSSILLPGAEFSLLSRNGWNGPFHKLTNIVDVQEALFPSDGSMVIIRNPAKLGSIIQLDRPEIRVIAPKAMRPVGFPWLLHHNIARMWLSPDAGRLLVDAESAGVRTLMMEDLALFQPIGELPGIASDPVREFYRDTVWIETLQGLRRSDYSSSYSSEPVPPSQQPLRIRGESIEREGAKWQLVEPQTESWSVGGSSRITAAFPGAELILASDDGVISFYNYDKGRSASPIALPASASLVSMVPVGETQLAIGLRESAGESSVQIVKPKTKQVVRELAVAGELIGLQSHEQKLIAFLKDGKVVEWDMTVGAGDPLALGSVPGADHLFFATDNRHYATVAGEKLQAGEAGAANEIIQTGVAAIAPLGKALYTLEKQQIGRWKWSEDFSSLARDTQWPLVTGLQVSSGKARLVPDLGALLVVSGSMMSVFDLANESWRFDPVQLGADVVSAIWAGSSQLAIGCQDGTIHFLSSETGQPMRTSMKLAASIRELAQVNPSSILVRLDSRVLSIALPAAQDESRSPFVPKLAETVGGWKLDQRGIPQRLDNYSAAFADVRAEEGRAERQSRWEDLADRLLNPVPRARLLDSLVAAVPASQGDLDEYQQAGAADALNALAAELRLPVIEGNGFYYAFTLPSSMTPEEREVTDTVARRRQADRWHLQPEEIAALTIAEVKIPAGPVAGDTGAARLYRNARARILTAACLSRLMKPGQFLSPGVEGSEETKDDKTGEVLGTFKRTIYPANAVIGETGVRLLYKQLWEGYSLAGERRAFGLFERSMLVTVDRLARSMLLYYGGGSLSADMEAQLAFGRTNVERAIAQLKLPGPSSRYLFVGLSIGSATKIEGNVEPVEPIAVEERLIEAPNETIGGGIILDMENSSIVAFGGGAANMDWAPVNE